MTPAGTPAVGVRKLGHQFAQGLRSQRILDGVDLSIEAGKSLALIGRSGSGKSTLLNLIAGLEPLQQGDIAIFEQSLKALDDHARTVLRREKIGFVHQAFNLIPTLDVADNVGLPLALAGQSKRDRHARVIAMLDEIGLPGRADDFTDTLSGGEQQRVAIARALIHEPPLLLADEPTGNLDAESGRHVLELLGSLVSERGTAMLIVTHSLEVAGIADAAATLHDGRLHELDANALTSGSAW